MKKAYLLFVLFIFFFNSIYSQQSNAQDVRFNLGKVSKNVTSGIEAYNLEDLKYFAKISKDAVEIVLTLLDNEQCYNTFDLADSISIYLETALLAEELVTARTYLSKAEDKILKAFYEYDLCTTEGISNSNSVNEDANSALTDLQKQQAELKAQQAALEQKAKDIKLKLAQQEEKESLLKKEQFIVSNERAIANNIKAYNELLKSCDCQETISSTSDEKSELSVKSLIQLRTYYLDKVIGISQNYTETLKKCKN